MSFRLPRCDFAVEYRHQTETKSQETDAHQAQLGITDAYFPRDS
jgi:hypothetical protein